MKHIFALLTFIFLGMGAAHACPNPGLTGQSFSYSSDDLWSERILNVTAGGNVDLDYCYDIPGTGSVITTPDFSLFYQRTQAYNLRIQTSGQCDTILLVNDASGNWYFSDDDGPGLGGEVWLYNATGGKIDIWVGTYGSNTCPAQLHLETFN